MGFRGISASAIKTNESDEGKSEYELTRVPNNHRCIQSSTSDLKRQFVKSLYNEVSKNPLKAVGKIYEETRSKFTSKLDTEDEKIEFLNDIPTFKAINPDLYRHREKFIPKAPSSQVSFHQTLFLQVLNEGNDESIYSHFLFYTNFFILFTKKKWSFEEKLGSIYVSVFFGKYVIL